MSFETFEDFSYFII